MEYEREKSGRTNIVKYEAIIFDVGDTLLEHYHHRFTFYDPDAKVEFSDSIEIHTLELNKLPDGEDGTKLYDWAKFIAAASYEELDKVAERNPEVKKA